jgi:hypothetical protein
MFGERENTSLPVVKSFTRRAVINGKHTLLEKVILDRTITLRFIDQDVIDSFPKEVSGFKCQSDGHVLTHTGDLTLAKAFWDSHVSSARASYATKWTGSDPPLTVRLYHTNLYTNIVTTLMRFSTR